MNRFTVSAQAIIGGGSALLLIAFTAGIAWAAAAGRIRLNRASGIRTTGTLDSPAAWRAGHAAALARLLPVAGPPAALALVALVAGSLDVGWPAAVAGWASLVWAVGALLWLAGIADRAARAASAERRNFPPIRPAP